jgi:hypothetical protein
VERTQRAAQIWPVLVLAATNRQVLTYTLLGKLIGVPGRGLGHLLEPIQSYCLMKDLPPLTILVVSEDTGLPGSGFTAAGDIPRTQSEVFRFRWLELQAPTEDELKSAVDQRPSRPQKSGET